jgi:hypothetical protein
MTTWAPIAVSTPVVVRAGGSGGSPTAGRSMRSRWVPRLPSATTHTGPSTGSRWPGASTLRKPRSSMIDRVLLVDRLTTHQMPWIACTTPAWRETPLSSGSKQTVHACDLPKDSDSPWGRRQRRSPNEMVTSSSIGKPSPFAVGVVAWRPGLDWSLYPPPHTLREHRDA